ncbi:MAG: carbohydrate ABC transporter permease [Chloroflexota bacterium]|nr:carbohydrate ABC transporter permease [Chloroflexota bacterium]
MKRRLRLSRVVHYLALILLGAIFAFPFYWMFVTSVEPTSRLSDIPPNILPLWDWSNYTAAWSGAPWGRLFLNTVFIASAATLLAVLTSLFAGYAFASLRFPFRNVLFFAALMVLVIPDEVILIPQYIILGDLNWLNTYQAEIVPFGASAFGIFLLRQFFLNLPRELWDAAQIDGCTRTKYLLRVAAPLSAPALAAIALYTFMGMWNQFLYPLVVAGLNPDVQPLQVGLATFLGIHSVEWSKLAAASVFTTLPILVVFLLLQKQLIEGVASAGGAVVG